MVIHVPTAHSEYRVNGLPPMRQQDTYVVVGCSWVAPGGITMPCIRVEWLTASKNLIVRGSPVLLHNSTGICIGAGAAGPPVIASYQMVVREPDDITIIN